MQATKAIYLNHFSRVHGLKRIADLITRLTCFISLPGVTSTELFGIFWTQITGVHWACHETTNARLGFQILLVGAVDYCM